MNILIAIGSTLGSTRGIAARIAALLEQSGHTVAVQDAKQVDNTAMFDGVILGGGVYRGQLHNDVMALAQKESATLATKQLAAFSVSLTAAESAPEKQAEASSYVEPLQNLLTVQRVATFAGAYNPKTASLLVRWVLKLVGAKPGDYRDWPAIEAWAAELASAWA